MRPACRERSPSDESRASGPRDRCMRSLRSGAAGAMQDVAIQSDRIAARGDLSAARGRQEIDASGLAVAPGFIDMLNHSETSLIADGRSQSGIRQGVTLAVFGESSMGPFSEQMKKDMMARQG